MKNSTTSFTKRSNLHKSTIHRPITAVSVVALNLVVAYSSNAQADTNLINAEAQDIKDVIVYASRSTSTSDQLPTHTSIISAEEISQSGAQSVDQLLRLIPGFNFTGVPANLSDPTGTQTKIRGLGNAKVLVLIDGIPAIDPFYLTTQWYKVDINQIDHIEVMRGGASSLWGSMAVGGVINIITKHPSDDGGVVNVSAGSQRTESASISNDAKITDSLFMVSSVAGSQTGGYNTTPSAYQYIYPGKIPSTDEAINVRLALYYKPSENLSAFFKIGQYLDEQNINYLQSVGANNRRGPDFSAGLNRVINDHTDVSVSLWAQSINFSKENGAGCYEVTSTSCVSSAAKIIANPLYATDSTFYYYSQKGQQSYSEQGTALVYSTKLNNLHDGLQIGIDYRRLSVNDQEGFYSAPGSTLSTPLFATADNQGEQLFKGAFGQYEFHPTKSIQLTGSVRYDYWSTAGVSSILTPINGKIFGGSQADISKQQFNPNFGAHIELTSTTDFRAAAYSAFRSPGLNNELRSYGFGASSSSTSVANPGLQPETSKGWEAGFDYHNSAVKLGATYFRTAINNMIATYKVTGIAGAPEAVLSLCGNGPLGQAGQSNCSTTTTYYSNNQDGLVSGMEIEGSASISRWLKAYVSYEYTSSYLTKTWNGVTTPLNQQLAGIPNNVADLRLTTIAHCGVSANLEAYSVGSLTYAQGTATTSPSNQGAFVIFNASLNYAMGDNTDIYLKAINLANKSYQDGTYTAGAPYSQTMSQPFSLLIGLRGKY